MKLRLSRVPSSGLVLAWLVAGLMACGDSASGPSTIEAPDTLGSLAVGHTAFTAVDGTRNDRPLPVDVWYPVDAQDASGGSRTFYPLAGPIGLESEVAIENPPVSAKPGRTLLVFSHGYGGIKLQSIGLMETLASHGFIVVAVEHTGNAQSTPTDSFDEAAAKRVPDVSFIIDVMIARGRNPRDVFHGRIHDTRVGVLGHSFGAMTAIGMVAGWAGAPADPRVAAIVPISAVIDGNLQRTQREGPNAGFSAEALARIAVPVLLIGGTEDTDVPIGNNEIAFEELVNAPRVYKLDVIGANHNHFASVCTFGDLLLGLGIDEESWPAVGAADLIEPYDATCTPDVLPIDEASRLVKLYSVAFFRRHLRGERAYERFLTEAFADSEPAAAFSVR